MSSTPNLNGITAAAAEELRNLGFDAVEGDENDLYIDSAVNLWRIAYVDGWIVERSIYEPAQTEETIEILKAGARPSGEFVLMVNVALRTFAIELPADCKPGALVLGFLDLLADVYGERIGEPVTVREI